MAIERIYIPQDSFSDICMGDLESLSSGMQTSSGITLNTSVKNFLAGNQRARNAQASADLADENAALISLDLFRHLRSDGFEPQMLVCQGIKVKLRGCSELMEQAIREVGERFISEDLIHFAVRVNNIVLDLGFRRLGDEYLHSNNAVFNAYARMWDKVQICPHKRMNNSSSFLSFVKLKVDATALKKAVLRLQANKKDDDGELGGVVHAATAASVINAFGKAKRNRRLRNPQK